MDVRFGDPGVLILVSLSSGPKHGYALIKDIEGISGSTLGPGTLYGALSRLEQGGLIEALPESDRRRPYRITPAGAEAVRLYLESIRRVANVGFKRLRALA
jgi:DNA-binding PadR family transcriptional regulator